MSIIIQPGHHTQKAQRMSEYLSTTTLGGPPQGTKRKTRSRPEIRALTGAGQQIGDLCGSLPCLKHGTMAWRELGMTKNVEKAVGELMWAAMWNESSTGSRRPGE